MDGKGVAIFESHVTPCCVEQRITPEKQELCCQNRAINQSELQALWILSGNYMTTCCHLRCCNTRTFSNPQRLQRQVKTMSLRVYPDKSQVALETPKKK
jgi:hypothetical protein